jgi:hypothetical protein
LIPHIERQASVSAENSYICNSPLKMMKGVTTLHIKQYEQYQLSTTDDCGESIKKREYFLVIEAKFENPSDTV